MATQVDPYAFTNAFNRQVEMGQQNRLARLSEMRAQAEDERQSQLMNMRQQQFAAEQQAMQQERELADRERASALLRSEYAPFARRALESGNPQQFVMSALGTPAIRQKFMQDGILDPDKVDVNAPDFLQGLQAIAAFGQEESGSRDNLGNANVGDFEPESYQAWLRSGDSPQTRDYSLLKRIWAPQVATIANVPTIVPRGSTAAPTKPLTTIGDVAANAGTVAGAEATARESAQTAAIAPRARAERAAEAPQRAERMRQVTAGAENVMTAIGTALKNSSGWTAGLIGSVGRAVPGSDAYDLQQTLLTIKANLGFDRLQAMRDASPTGGALGQVAVQELQSLQATVASLDQLQSPEALKRALRNIETHYRNWVDAVKEANTDLAKSPASGGWGKATVVP